MWLLKLINLALLCFGLILESDSAKILGIFFVPSISHQIAYRPIWRELSIRGHNVTVISPNILNDSSLTNLTEIDISFAYDILGKFDLQKNAAKENFLVKNFITIHNMMFSVMHAILEYGAVQDLIHSDEEFDLILVESLHPLVFSFGARFKAPIIAVSSIEVFVYIYDIFANPTHPISNPDMMMYFEREPSFIERIRSLTHNVVSRLCYYWWILPQSDVLARMYFGEDMPDLEKIISNTSLLLINRNPIMHSPRPNVPTVIEIGQMHIREKKNLPEDLQTYLDSSEKGVVYFSLGSNIKSANLSGGLQEIIKQALSELPFDIIWKWETEQLPGKPDNVLIREWLPQQDILGHPNVKVFVTQGGLQSIEEAVVNGVPMVGIPFWMDQFNNVKILADKGMGIGLNYNTMTKEELRKAIFEVATNSKFKKQLEKAKNILLDQPVTGLNKAIWWIEYVLRHKETTHLRTPSADMSFFQYFMVDVFAFLLLSICIFVYLLKMAFRMIVGSKNNKIKTN
ncbi:UDP-glucosyltransferase 2 [Leptinotarsa decemlineata]|uniref:UDP-glucosyltransferase 2 n=1 Tax=Leptinotarsa decemlineata TaxID=7539 RepID=UPI003D30AE7A